MEELETPPVNEVPDESAGTPELSETVSAGPSEEDAIEAAESEGMVAGPPENDGAAAGGSDEASGGSEAAAPEVAAATELSEAASAEPSLDDEIEAAENEGMVADAPEDEG